MSKRAKLIALFLLITGAILMSKKGLPRGVRYNNPLNIREGQNDPNHWQGEHLLDLDEGYEEFTAPKWGFRAAARILRNYQRFYGYNSLRELITRFAPKNENDTDNYISFVSKRLDVSPDAPLPLSDDQFMSRMLHTMSIMEVGRYFTLEDAAEGVALA